MAAQKVSYRVRYFGGFFMFLAVGAHGCALRPADAMRPLACYNEAAVHVQDVRPRVFPKLARHVDAS